MHAFSRSRSGRKSSSGRFSGSSGATRATVVRTHLRPRNQRCALPSIRWSAEPRRLHGDRACASTGSRGLARLAAVALLAVVIVLLAGLLPPRARAAVSCPNSNPIVNENQCHTGTAGWDVADYSDQLGGFTTKTSVIWATTSVLKVGQQRVDLPGDQREHRGVPPRRLYKQRPCQGTYRLYKPSRQKSPASAFANRLR